MPIINLTAKYRPVRVGFLVRPDRVEDLVRAAELNALLWGGLFNPIIPVAAEGEDNSHRDQLMAAFRPDTFYEVAESAAIRAFVEKHPFLSDPGHLGERFFYEDWPSKKNAVAYLDVISLIRRIWRDLRSAPETESNCVLLSWQPEDLLASLFALEFGSYPANDNLRDDFPTAFVRGLKASKLEIPLNGSFDGAMGTKVTPLHLTKEDLNQSGGNRVDAPGLFIGRSNDFNDLLAFWNLRAAGTHLRFCPLESVERLRPQLQSFLDYVDGVVSSQPDFDSISFVYTCSDEEAQPILQSYPTEKRKLRWKYGRGIWNGLNVQPTRNYFEWQKATGTVERRFGRYSIALSLPEKKFLRERDDTRHIGQQTLAVSLESSGELGHEGATLRIPLLPDLNEFYSREIAFDPWKLRAERDGFALLIHAYEDSETIFPIESDKLIERLFQYAGIKNEISQPGRLAAKIIARMREHNPLEACRVFKIRGVRTLLKRLKPPAAVSAAEAMRIIWNGGQFKAYERLYIEAREKHKLSTSDVLRFLVKKGIIRPRIGKVRRLFSRRREARCASCGLANQVRLADYENPSWQCSYCGKKQNLRVRVAKEFHGQKGWTFSRNGLFAKDNNQEGAIPVLLVLLTFKRVLDSRNPIFSTARKLRVGKLPCETDFVILSYTFDRQVELAIGEAKDEGGAIDDQDISNLRAARSALIKRVPACFLVFAKTADAFSTDELTRFAKLRDEGVPFILLTNRELEPYHPYWDEEAAPNVPHKYAHSMGEMAENGYSQYLA